MIDGLEPLRRTMKSASRKGVSLALLATLAACSKTTDPTVVIETAPVERRTIVLSAQANGTVEPVTVVEVKSKASGTIIRMPVDIGSNVKVGDLLVQIDPRDVQNQYDQSAADLQLGNGAALGRTRAAEPVGGSVQAEDHHPAGDGAGDARFRERGCLGDQGAHKSLDRQGAPRGRDGSGADQRHDHRASRLGRNGHHFGDVVGERGHDDPQDGRPQQSEDAVVRERDRHRQRAAGPGRDGHRRRVPEPKVRRNRGEGRPIRPSCSRA